MQEQSSEIRADPRFLVVYHGTSSVFEQDIEDRGLEPFNRLFDPRDVDRVREAFENLRWYGSADSGYMFLASYSRERHRGDRQCVYCCSYPNASLLFSTTPSQYGGLD